MRTRAKLLEVLHPTIWKSTRELWTEAHTAIGPTCIWLNALEEDGLVISRERAGLSAERLKARHGAPEREHKLTDKGMRKRCRIENPAVPDGLPDAV